MFLPPVCRSSLFLIILMSTSRVCHMFRQKQFPQVLNHSLPVALLCEVSCTYVVAFSAYVVCSYTIDCILSKPSFVIDTVRNKLFKLLLVIDISFLFIVCFSQQVNNTLFIIYIRILLLPKMSGS